MCVCVCVCMYIYIYIYTLSGSMSQLPSPLSPQLEAGVHLDFARYSPIGQGSCKAPQTRLSSTVSGSSMSLDECSSACRDHVVSLDENIKTSGSGCFYFNYKWDVGECYAVYARSR